MGAMPDGFESIEDCLCSGFRVMLDNLYGANQIEVEELDDREGDENSTR